MEHLATLGARRNAQDDRAGHRRHVCIGAHHQLRVGDEYLGVEILPVALETWVVGHLEHDVDVASYAAPRARVPDAAEGHVLPGCDAGRHTHHDLALTSHATIPPALLARMLDHGSLAFARRARRNRDHL